MSNVKQKKRDCPEARNLERRYPVVMFRVYEDEADVSAFLEELDSLGWPFCGISHDGRALRTHHHIVCFVESGVSSVEVYETIPGFIYDFNLGYSLDGAFRYLARENHCGRPPCLDLIYGPLTEKARAFCSM